MKLEFGYYQNKIILADELSLDNMRVLDKNNVSLDKDLYRFKQGDVVKGYEKFFKIITKNNKNIDFDLHDKCGVVGIINKKNDVNTDLFLALHALQHRGQEGSGIVTIKNNIVYEKKYQS